MRVTIPRSKWIRGGSHTISMLWDKTRDCGCVLGHFGLALGYTRDDLKNVGSPMDSVLFPDDNRWPEWIVFRVYDEDLDDYTGWKDTLDAEDIIGVNDTKEFRFMDGDRSLLTQSLCLVAASSNTVHDLSSIRRSRPSSWAVFSTNSHVISFAVLFCDMVSCLSTDGGKLGSRPQNSRHQGAGRWRPTRCYGLGWFSSCVPWLCAYYNKYIL